MADARRMGKMELFAHFADRFELKRAQAREFFDELAVLSEKELKRSGEFVLPGLFKINTVKKPATKARKGIDPFTKQERVFAAKPASVKVKVRPLKKLKDLAG